ncbi:MAG: sugar ABC transporter permease [Candidatus Latescibacterota bacterium]|nr:MAG: sugar ABC transporter permease [Candidatus Latescibacterota bacterium]
MSKRKLVGLAFVAPALLVFVLFKYVPMLQVFRMSLYDWSILNPPGEFVGLKHFKEAFSSSLFWIAWKNNLVLFLLGLVLGFWVPLVQAIMLGEMRRGQYIFRVCYLLPLMVPPMVTLVVWKWIYNPEYGLLNAILTRLGLPPQDWLGNPKLAKLSLVLPGLLGGGMGVMVYLAAIQGVPQELFEAAEIDGAGPLQKLRYILLPRIRFVILIQFILALSAGFQMFDRVFVLTGGGPVDATRVIALLIYRYAFESYRMGYASAIALVLFVVILTVTALQMRLSKLSD